MEITVMELPVGQIDVGERRRTDLGDIAGLAQGIRRVGLLEPILVDRNGSERYRLVFGERRLRAVRLLKHATIRAQLRDQLSEEEFRAIELAENEDRKALTDGERGRTFEASKKLVENAKKAAGILENNSPEIGRRGRGHPPKAASARAVAAALGVDRTDVRRAKQQVEAAERFPWMQGKAWRQAHVLAIREQMKGINEHEQAQVAEVLKCAPALKPALAVELVEKIVGKPRKEREQLYALSQSTEPRDRALAFTRARDLPAPPPPCLACLEAAMNALRHGAELCSGTAFAARWLTMAKQLEEHHGALLAQRGA